MLTISKPSPSIRRGDDECFRNGRCGDQQVTFDLERCNANIHLCLGQHDGHQCRRIDSDHLGSPSSP